MAHVPYHAKGRFAGKLKQIWLQPDLESARQYAAAFIAEYEERFPEAIECLLEGLEDSLQCYQYPAFDKRAGKIEQRGASKNQSRGHIPKQRFLYSFSDNIYPGIHRRLDDVQALLFES